MRRLLLAFFSIQATGAVAVFESAWVAALLLVTATGLLLVYLRTERSAVEVRLAAGIKARTRELSDLVEMHQQASITDPLTNLLNRRGGEQEINRHIARCRRVNTPMSFLIVDVDFFKRVNDSFGHNFGDDVLCAVGKIVSTTMRTSDFAVRWGGEEVLVALPDTDLRGAVLVGEKLRRAVEEVTFARNVRITVSIGVSEVSHSDDFHTSIGRADMNLYIAKASGRNCVRPQFNEKRT